MDCSPTHASSSVHGTFQGKNTGVGCHFLLHQRVGPDNRASTYVCMHVCMYVCMYVCVCCSVMSDSFHPMDCSPPGSSPRNSSMEFFPGRAGIHDTNFVTDTVLGSVWMLTQQPLPAHSKVRAIIACFRDGKMRQ